MQLSVFYLRQRRIVVVVVVILLQLPSLTDGFLFRLLLGPYLDGVIERTCTAVEESTAILNGFTSCDCSGEFQGILSGFTGDVSCALDTDRCFVPPSSYCGRGKLDANLEFGLFRGAGLASDITACFTLRSGPPPELSSFGKYDRICVDIVPAADGEFKLEDCSVTIGDEACKSCTICKDNTGFQFDCSNVDISGPVPVFVPGPVVTTCLGLSLDPV